MSIEFMIVVSIILLVFIIMGYAINQKMREAYLLKFDISGRAVADQIADAINEIVSVGDGFSQKIVLPPRVYTAVNYTVHFYPDDPTVFVKAEDKTWSSPLYTTNISCAVEECRYKCNQTPEEVCLNVDKNRTIELEASNRMGSVSIGYPHEAEQNGNKWKIIPFRGNNTPGPDLPVAETNFTDPANLFVSTPPDVSTMYLYENTETMKTSLVFLHNFDPITNPQQVKIEAEEPYGSPIGNYTNDEGVDPPLSFPPFNNNTPYMGWWQSPNSQDARDGGVVEFQSSAFHLCLRHDDVNQKIGNWTWTNADGSIIELDDTWGLTCPEDCFCITYP
ncbi:hypothetical protein ACFLRC_04595 [Candidatus Altiarchaeota archaeon]